MSYTYFWLEIKTIGLEWMDLQVQDSTLGCLVETCHLQILDGTRESLSMLIN